MTVDSNNVTNDHFIIGHDTRTSIEPKASSRESESNDQSGSMFIFYSSKTYPLSIIRNKLGQFGRTIIDAIREGKDIRDLLGRINFSLDYELVRELAEEAVKYKNIAALTALAEINAIVVGRVIEEHINELGKIDDLQLFHLYYLTKNELSKQKEQIFRKIVSHLILKKALGIIGKRSIKSGIIRKKVYYKPFLDFDLDATLERSFDKIISKSLTNRDIIGVERHDKRTSGVVIIDYSGSMFGEKNLLASLVSALVVYSLSHSDEYSIIVFSDDAYIIKGINEGKPLSKILEILFDLKPLGYTNIARALKVAAGELKKSRIKTRKWAILITDGEYNRGENPFKYATLFPKLHVVQLGGGPLGTYVCKSLAKGRGRYLRVKSLEGLLRAVRTLLKYPDR